MGGLLLAARENDTGPVRSAVDTEFSSDLLHAYLELYSDAPEPLANATVMVEVVPRGARGRSGRDIGLLPAGDYVVHAILTVSGREAGRVTRQFRIVPKK